MAAPPNDGQFVIHLAVRPSREHKSIQMARSTDFDFFLNQRNPYKQTMPGRAGSDRSPGADLYYPTWADVMKGTDWQNQQIAQNNALGAAAAPGTSVSGPADTSNPFTTLRNVKNPGIDAAVNAVLQQTSSLSGPQPDTVVRTTRSQPLADRLSDEFHNFDTDRDGNRSTLADFTSSYLAADPQAKAITDQEIGSVGEFYDGTVRSELDNLAGARRIATAGALTPAIQAVMKQRNMGALLGGNDSYLDSQVADRAGRLARDAAIDNAEQLKGNYLYAREGQNKMLGARTNLLNNYLTRNLVPIEAGQRINQNDLSRLYGIGAADNANTNYRVTNPQTELAIKLGLLGDASRIDLGNTFYGLQKPYEPNAAGLIRQPGFGTGSDPAYSGGYYGPAADAIIARGGQPNIAPTAKPVAGAFGSGVLTPDQEFQFFQQYGEWPYGDPPQTNSYGATSNTGGTGTPLFPAGRYFQSNIPAYEGYDSVPMDFLGGYA